MAGDNQHYLARLLLRGFLNQNHGERVWRFQKGCLPEDSPIEHVGADFRFYGDSGPKTPDHKITQKEKRYGDILHRIRKSHREKSNEPIVIKQKDREIIPEMVVHFIIRTKYQREVVDDLAMPSMSAWLRSILLPKRAKQDEIYAMLARPLVEKIEEQLRAQIKDSHSQVSGAALSPNSRYQKYRGFLWSIPVYTPGTFILGDLGPVVLCGQGRVFKAPFSHTEEARAILLPIAHDLLLVGQALHEEALERPNSEAINIATAELSREFFVSSRWSPREERYLSLLGRAEERIHASS